MPFGFHPLYLMVLLVFIPILLVGLVLMVRVLVGAQARPKPAGLFSGDHKWWWDGHTWQPAVTDDGRWRWDGQRWMPSSPSRPD